MLDLSIIVVSWNARDRLVECLRSIVESKSACTREVIVIDNASTDGSVEAARRAMPEAKLVCNAANLGFAKANNEGIRRSSGRYVCLMNSDVVVLPGSLDAMARFLDERPEVGVAGPRILNADGTVQASCRRFPTVWNVLLRTFALDCLFRQSDFAPDSTAPAGAADRGRKVDAVSGCFCVARREALDRVGLLDEDFFFYSEDVDWCLRFRKAGWEVVCYPGAQAVHYGGASTDNAPARFFVEMGKADLRYWRKHFGRAGMAYRGAMLFLHQAVRLAPRIVEYAVLPSRRASAGPKIERSVACLRWLLGISSEPPGRKRSGH